MGLPLRCGLPTSNPFAVPFFFSAFRFKVFADPVSRQLAKDRL